MKKLQMIVLMLMCFLSVEAYSRSLTDLKKVLEPVQKGSDDDCIPDPDPEEEA